MKAFPTVLSAIILILFNHNVHVTNSTTDESDYYWREYIGVIPSDALAAGTDKSGKAVYIGQGFFKNIGLLPATIFQGSNSIKVTALGQVYTSEKNVKILCTRNPEKYRWIPTKIEEMHLLTNCNLVVGGTETDDILNIGRVNHEMDVQIGKVYPNHSPYNGLAIPHKGKEANYKSYEVLTYNCTIKQYCEPFAK